MVFDFVHPAVDSGLSILIRRDLKIISSLNSSFLIGAGRQQVRVFVSPKPPTPQRRPGSLKRSTGKALRSRLYVKVFIAPLDR